MARHPGLLAVQGGLLQKLVDLGRTPLSKPQAGTADANARDAVTPESQWPNALLRRVESPAAGRLAAQRPASVDRSPGRR
jgi:hypothetical protein